MKFPVNNSTVENVSHALTTESWLSTRKQKQDEDLHMAGTFL